MQIYNSRSKQKEELNPIVPGEIKMYICGPTLYSEIHIGNARPLIFFDVVYRYLMHKGYDVKYVTNITDIDDKIIKRAAELNVSESELVEDNIVMFDKVKDDLNLAKPMAVSRVTKCIDEIINYIQELIDSGNAYEQDGDVYFSVDKIDDYGAISNRKLEDLQAGSRIAADIKKRYEHDFVLWKKTSEGIQWDAPFGRGRPGWHTECVVMINQILGKTIDIHGGGMDLKFPHHENEEAQSLACGCSLSNIWMHNGFVNIEDTKMSKSLGNVIYPRAIIDEHGANFLRLLMVKSSYRGPINISDDVTNQIKGESTKLKRLVEKYGLNDTYVIDDNVKQIETEMDNDFNTANALSIFFKMMSSNISDDEKKNLQTFIYEIFGFVNEYIEEDIPEIVLKIIEKRKVAKKDRNFELADQLRQEANDLGYEIKDTREGVQCHKI